MRLIAVADPALTPLPAAHTQFFPLRDAEHAVALLENVALDELWLIHDLEDAEGVINLVEYLLVEARWSTRPQIGTIVVMSRDVRESAALMARLAANYHVVWQPLEQHRFHPLPIKA